MYLYGHGCWTDFVKWASESWRFVVGLQATSLATFSPALSGRHAGFLCAWIVTVKRHEILDTLHKIISMPNALRSPIFP